VKRRKDSELLLLIYTEAGEIAGMAHVSYHCVPIKPVGYVSAVVIDEKYRGHGLGLILVEEIERRAKERWSDIKAFNLTSKPSRGTQGFYLRLGYRMRTKEAGDETIFYVKDVDGYAHS
jgi:GNAT superfamily N-acetyltransferase